MEALGSALQATVQQWRGRFPSPLPLELYTSSNFIGLFVEEQVADVLKQFAADFAQEAARKAGRNKPANNIFNLLYTTHVVTARSCRIIFRPAEVQPSHIATLKKFRIWRMKAVTTPSTLAVVSASPSDRVTLID